MNGATKSSGPTPLQAQTHAILRCIRSIGLLFLAGALIAQEAAAAERKKRPGRYKLGPLYLTPKISLQNAGVDTNVLNQLTGGFPDTSVVLRSSLAGALPLARRVSLTGDGWADANYFRRERSERSTDLGGWGRAELNVGPATLFGSGGGSQAKQRFSIDLDQRVLRQERWATLGIDLRLRRKISLILTGTGRVLEFGNLVISGEHVKDVLDRDEVSASGQLRFAVTRRTSLVATAEAIEDRFLGRMDLGPRRVQSFRYLGGFEFGERAILSGQVTAGLREFPSTGGGAPSYRGPLLAVSATLPLLRFGRLKGVAERDVFYAVDRVPTREERLRNTYVSTHLRSEAALALPFELVGRLSIGFEKAKYVLPQPAGNALVRRVDHRWTTVGTLLHRFGERLLIGGTVTWTRRVSNFRGLAYEGLRYGIQGELVP